MLRHSKAIQSVLWSLTAAILLVLTPSSISQASTDLKRVLILNSYHREYSWSEHLLKGIDDAISASGLNVETYSFFMDLKRTPYSEEYIQQIKQLIQIRYRNIPFDIIIGCDNDAFDFLRKYRDELFPMTPMVFSALNDFDPSMLDGRKDITGTAENIDYAGTIALALRTYPPAKEVFVVTDKTTTGLAHLSAVKKVAPQFAGRLKFNYLSFSDYAPIEFVQKLASLPNDSAVLLLHHFMDKNNVSYSVPEITSELTAKAPVPSFSVTDVRIGFGVLGGHVTSGYRYGMESGKMAVKILSGVNVADLPIMIDAANEYIFDRQVLKRFNIPDALLPAGSVIINEPFSFIDKYRAQIVFAALVFLLLCIIIAHLVLNVRRRKQIEKVLRESEEKFSKIFKDAPVWIAISDMESSACLDVNDAVLRSSGFTRQEMIGRTAVDIGWVTSEDRLRLVKEAEEKGRVHGLGIAFRAKDGRVLNGVVNGEFVQINGRKCLLTVTVDMTEIKRLQSSLLISEQCYQDLFNAMVNAFSLHEIVLDKEGVPCDYRFLAVNSAFERITGLNAKNIVGNTVLQVLPQTERKWIDIYGKVALTGKPCRFEEYSSVQDKYFEVSAYRPNPGQFACVFADITERKKIQQVLQENASRLQLATTVGKVGVWDWDILNNQLTWDESMYTLYGLPKEHFGGAYEAWMATLHPDDIAATAEDISAALRGDREYASEFRIVRPDGEVRNIKAISKTFYDGSGTAYRMIGTNVDITERQKTEALLRSARDDAEAANNAKSEFLTGISHDLRTPLHAIVGFCSLIDPEKIDPKHAQYVRIIKDKANYLSELVQSILEASRLQSGKVQLSPSPINIIAMIEMSVNSARFNLSQKPVQIFFTYDDFPPLMADHLRFQQIIDNLLGNAVKYTKNGRVIVTAKCLPSKTGPDTCRLQLSVKDTGLGISKEKMTDLFKPFVRLNDALINETRPGMGIGLFIVKTAVDLMGGEIALLSDVGKGTEFIITLDLAKAPASIAPKDR